MLKLFFSFLLLIAGLESFAASPIDFITFPDNFECNEKFPHHSFCEAVVFKPWAESEKNELKNILKELDRPELKNFYKTIKEKGTTKFHRVSFSSRWVPNQIKRRAEFIRVIDNSLIWADPVTGVVGITDKFFKSSDFIDPYAKLPRKTLNILHELAHVYDIARKHVSSEIKSEMGWYWDGKEDTIKSIDYKKSQQEFREILEYLQIDSSKTYSEDRLRGIQYGYPTLYSMTNGHECFAELVTYYVLDPEAKKYLSEEIQTTLNKILESL